MTGTRWLKFTYTPISIAIAITITIVIDTALMSASLVESVASTVTATTTGAVVFCSVVVVYRIAFVDQWAA